MASRRPCAVCRKWFQGDPRAGGRQKVCGSRACLAEANRRACRRWRKANAEKVEAYLFRRRLPATPSPAVEVEVVQPMAHFDMDVVRQGVGVKTAVLLEEFAKVLSSRLRHGVPSKMKGKGTEIEKVLAPAPRHETASGPGPP